jgi:hypothetical protein
LRPPIARRLPFRGENLVSSNTTFSTQKKQATFVQTMAELELTKTSLAGLEFIVGGHTALSDPTLRSNVFEQLEAGKSALVQKRLFKS